MIPTQHTIPTTYMVGPVHCYSAELNGELTLFDTGPPTESGQGYLRKNLDLSQLKHVIITHCHIDHYGLTRWLEQETNATIYLPYRDGLKISQLDQRLDRIGELLAGIGYDRQFLSEFRQSMDDGSTFPPFPINYKIIERDLPRHLGLEVLNCPGHSQSDLVFATSDWAVTGDVLLRGIFQSPLLDVDLETGDRFSNYHAYCSTLEKLARLRNRHILPGHRKSVESVDTTILFYLDKLLRRAALLKSHRNKGSVADIVKHLFGNHLTQAFHYYLKASEVVFMFDFLEEPDRLQTSLEAIGLFDAVAEKFQKATDR
ncbi:MAG TPA: MBL fold metallo-hydrolase [Geopsychrobacteraceae bacterium]|nr:MBL fold metallo-hydrolase [Geopsychrobacteraceae bacterium]